VLVIVTDPASARIIEAGLFDEHQVLSVSSLLTGHEHGVDRVT
jgi:hypothetical protein